MRGKPAFLWAISAKVRITPADAGKTQTAIPVHHIRGDHPRRCGENRVGVGGADGNSGSPPQVRGKLRASTGRTGSSRITPAGAGKTFYTQSPQPQAKDHPRRCGENSSRFFNRVALTGITPAGAGKTSGSGPCCCGCWDHPRRCGENHFSCECHDSRSGSPPQVRGKRFLCFIGVARRRITPAGAGKTYAAAACTISHEDHPRRCGENRQKRQTHHYVEGSPPQVRGKHPTYLELQYQRRITPAGAGKTGLHRARSCARADHPRRCGENNFIDAMTGGTKGSPPQVRGKPDKKQALLDTVGITPAGAGKTCKR